MFGEMMNMTRSGFALHRPEASVLQGEILSRGGEVRVNCQGLTPRYIMVAYQSRPMNSTMDHRPRT